MPSLGTGHLVSLLAGFYQYPRLAHSHFYEIMCSKKIGYQKFKSQKDFGSIKIVDAKKVGPKIFGPKNFCVQKYERVIKNLVLV